MLTSTGCGRARTCRVFFAATAFVLLLAILGGGTWWGGAVLVHELMRPVRDLQGTVETTVRGAIGNRSSFAI